MGISTGGIVVKNREGRPMTREEVENLSEEQIRIMIARESLVRWGTVFPPDSQAPARVQRSVALIEAPAPAQISPRLKRKPGPKPKTEPGEHVDWSAIRKLCPHCQETKFVVPGFGTKTKAGREYSQSYCVKCRATTSNQYRR